MGWSMEQTQTRVRGNQALENSKHYRKQWDDVRFWLDAGLPPSAIDKRLDLPRGISRELIVGYWYTRRNPTNGNV